MLYNQFNSEHPIVGGSKARTRGIPRKYLREREKCFNKYETEIAKKIRECKEAGLSAESTIEVLEDNFRADDNVYGFSIASVIIGQIIKWLIGKLIDYYFND